MEAHNIEKGAFLQHGEIQINPSRELWCKLFEEEAPKINLNLTNDEIIEHLKNSFLKNNSDLKIYNIDFGAGNLRNLLNF